MPVRTFGDVPVLCGHRGSGRGVVDGRPENTIPSFAAAVDAGMRWVEVDARLTVDGELVARHDPTVEDGRWVARMTAAETDEAGLMRVADLFAFLPSEIAVDVDVKSALEDALRPRDATTAAAVADLVARERERRQLLVTSFDAGAVALLRERLPDVPIGLLTWGHFPLRKAIPAAVHLGADVVAPHVTSFGLRSDTAPHGERDPVETIAVAHAAGLQVAVWCPEPDEQQVLVDAGVDCLMIDDAPVLARGR